MAGSDPAMTLKRHDLRLNLKPWDPMPQAQRSGSVPVIAA
jgi:hypothetical protein